VTAASVRLHGDDTDSTIDAYELFSARRALELLKPKLGRESLLELLAEEIAEGEAFLRGHLERSAGEEASGTTILRAHGITAPELGAWMGRAFAREEVMLAGHPEHWDIHAEPGRDVNIVETLDEYVCSFFMRAWDDADALQQELPATEDTPTARRSHMVLADGTVVGAISTAFEEEDEGFTARLSVTLPASCAPAAIEQHLEHFAVEFRSWILRAARELSAAA